MYKYQRQNVRDAISSKEAISYVHDYQRCAYEAESEIIAIIISRNWLVLKSDEVMPMRGR